MPELQELFTALLTKPSYTLMRGAARFKTIRTVVEQYRRFTSKRRTNEFLAACESRFAHSIFGGIKKEEIVHHLIKEGLGFGLQLPDAFVKEIFDFAMQTPVFADRRPDMGFRLGDRNLAEAQLGKPILVAQYFNSQQNCPTVGLLSEDPMLWWIAGRYLGSIPKFVGANLWWTFPVKPLEEDKDRHAHLFHRDVDDFRFFKFFFYLTPVESGDGAHVCVASSHVTPPVNRFGDPWNLRRYSDTEIADTYPPKKILEICGDPGIGFAENTLCIHKGLTPTKNPRLLLQLQFALFDYGVMHDKVDPSALKMMVL